MGESGGVIHGSAWCDQDICAVVESGSFSAVARELGVGQPAVSKQVASLEAHLGAQLLMRTSRNLSLTEAGRDFYKSGARLIGDLEAAESRVGRGQASPSGVVRVTVAHAFSRLYVVPRLPKFFARYPDVGVEMLVSERTSNRVFLYTSALNQVSEQFQALVSCGVPCW
jgi:DNA-binding transcriptional LysR family regulator